MDEMVSHALAAYPHARTQATEQDVQTEFSRFGTVKEVHLPLDRETGRKKGSAFVLYGSVKEATDAVNGMNK